MSNTTIHERLVKCLEHQFSTTVHFHVDKLRMELNCVDPAMIQWVMSYLDPWPKWPGSNDHCRFRLGCIHSDELVKIAMQLLSKLQKEERLSITAYEFREFNYIDVAPGTTIYLDRTEGIIWIVDREKYRATIVYSSKTRWPSFEFARFTREVVVRHLEDNGWVKYHAGAVRITDKTAMIIGDGGAGKTSLILALLAEGGQYISNERLFVKEEGAGLRATGFPMPIAIGLGSALQFPAISRFIHEPQELMYRQRRLDRKRLRKTPKKQWTLLPDKIQVMPMELADILRSPPPVSYETIDAIVVPDLEPGVAIPKGSTVSTGELGNCIKNNELTLDSDVRYPDWARLRQSTTSSYNDVLLQLPAIKLRYYDTMNATKKTRLFSDEISRAVFAS